MPSVLRGVVLIAGGGFFAKEIATRSLQLCAEALVRRKGPGELGNNFGVTGDFVSGHRFTQA